MKNPKLIGFIIGIFMFVLIVGVGYLLISGHKNNINEGFSPQSADNFIEEKKGEDGSRIFVFDDLNGGTYEVKDDMYLTNGEHSIYYDDYPTDRGTIIRIISTVPINNHEDGGIKKIENSRSLLNSDYKFETTKNDERYKYVINDFNTSSLTFTPEIKDGDNAPFKINDKEVANIRNQQRITFNNINVMTSNFTIGEHSTTFRISNNGGTYGTLFGNDGDPYLDVRNSTEFYSTDYLGQVGQKYYTVGGNYYYVRRAIINFSLSGLPSDAIILNGNLSIYVGGINGVFDVVVKNNTYNGTSLASNFEGWAAGNSIYGGRNMTNAISTSDLVAGWNNLTLSNDGINQTLVSRNAGIPLSFIIMSEDDVEAKQPAGLEQIDVTTIALNYPLLILEYELLSTPPSIGLNNLILNSTFGTNKSNEDLKVSFTPVVNNTSTPLYANITWFKNLIFYNQINNTLLTNGTHFENTLSSANTQVGNNWSVVINATFKEGYIAFNNITNYLYILNSPPTQPTLLFPDNGITTINYIMNLSAFNSTDDDGDAVNYEFYIDLDTNPPTTLVANDSDFSVIANLSDDGIYYWRARSNDGMDVSSYSDTRSFIVDRRLILSNITIYNSITQEGALNNFKLNLTLNKQIVSSVSSSFYYNGISKDVIKLDESENITSFLSSFNIPINSPQISTFSFNLTINLYNGTTLYNNSFFGSQQVKIISLYNCSSANASSVMIINFSFAREDNYVDINNTFEGYFKYTPLISNQTRELNVLYNDNINVTQVGICISPKDSSVYITDGEVKYNDQDNLLYDARYYYMRNDLFYNITREIKLYSLPKLTAVPITFTLKSSVGELINDYIIEVYKHTIGTNDYKLVAMGKTAIDGGSLIYLKQGDTPYQFLIRDDTGEYKEPFNNFITNADKILEKATYEIKLGVGLLVSKLIEHYQGMKGGLIYDNGTSTFVYLYNDSSSKTTSTNLRIQKIDKTGTHVLYERTFLGNNAYYAYTLNNATGTYMASVSVIDTDGNEFPIYQASNEISEPKLYDFIGSEGLLATFFILITYVMMAVTNAIAVMVLSMTAIILVTLLGILNISTMTLITFCILVGGIIIYKIKN